MAIQYASNKCNCCCPWPSWCSPFENKNLLYKKHYFHKTKEVSPNNALLVIVWNAGLSLCSVLNLSDATLLQEMTSLASVTIPSLEVELVMLYLVKNMTSNVHFIENYPIYMSILFSELCSSHLWRKICIWIIFKHIQLSNSLTFWFNNHASFINDFSYLQSYITQG